MLARQVFLHLVVLLHVFGVLRLPPEAFVSCLPFGQVVALSGWLNHFDWLQINGFAWYLLDRAVQDSKVGPAILLQGHQVLVQHHQVSLVLALVKRVCFYKFMAFLQLPQLIGLWVTLDLYPAWWRPKMLLLLVWLEEETRLQMRKCLLTLHLWMDNWVFLVGACWLLLGPVLLFYRCDTITIIRGADRPYEAEILILLSRLNMVFAGKSARRDIVIKGYYVNFIELARSPWALSVGFESVLIVLLLKFMAWWIARVQLINWVLEVWPEDLSFGHLVGVEIWARLRWFCFVSIWVLRYLNVFWWLHLVDLLWWNGSAGIGSAVSVWVDWFLDSALVLVDQQLRDFVEFFILCHLFFVLARIY